jgi:MFS family permease
MLSVLPRVPRQPITEKLSLFQTAQLLFSNPIYKRLWLGYAIVTMFGYSVSAFFGPFFMRSHGLTGTEVGATFGAVNIVLGTAGVFLGGFLHDWANELLPGSGLYPATAGLLISIVLALIGFLSPNLKISIIGVAGAIFLYFFILGPTMTLAQSLSPPPLRAYSSALMGVSAGLVGASGGPAIAGLLSDLLSSWAQGDALRYALAGMTAFEMIGMALYCQVSRRMVSAARKERISATSPMCKVGLLETVQSNGQSSPGYH